MLTFVLLLIIFYAADKVCLTMYFGVWHVCGGVEHQVCSNFNATYSFLYCLKFNFKVGPPAHRPIIAAGVRAVIYIGWKTGPGLNPMVAFSWVRSYAPSYAYAYAHDRSQNPYCYYCDPIW